MAKLKMLSLCSGIGGLDIGAEMTGKIEVVGQVEIDPFCRRILVYHWPHVTQMEDIHDVRGDEFGPIDILAGGIPCQGNSTAGKRRGREDERNLWPEFRRLLRATGARWAVVENVRGLLSSNVDRRTGDYGIFGDILRDLAELGFDAGWCVLAAADAGAPHKRERVFLVAHLADTGRTGQPGRGAGGGPTPLGETLNARTSDSGVMADRDDQGRHRGAQLPDGWHEIQAAQQLWPDTDRRDDALADTPGGRQHPGESGHARWQTGPTAALCRGEQRVVGDASGTRLQERHGGAGTARTRAAAQQSGTGQAQSRVGRVTDGLPCRLVPSARTTTSIERRRLTRAAAHPLTVPLSRLPPSLPNTPIALSLRSLFGADGALRWPTGPGMRQNWWESPRTLVGTLLERAAMLKALGNGVVWPVAHAVFAAIVTTEEAHYGR